MSKEKRWGGGVSRLGSHLPVLTLEVCLALSQLWCGLGVGRGEKTRAADLRPSTSGWGQWVYACSSAIINVPSLTGPHAQLGSRPYRPESHMRVIASLRLRCRGQTCGHSESSREWDEWKSSINMYILQCVKSKADGNLLYNPGSPASCYVMT